MKSTTKNILLFIFLFSFSSINAASTQSNLDDKTETTDDLNAWFYDAVQNQDGSLIHYILSRPNFKINMNHLMLAFNAPLYQEEIHFPLFLLFFKKHFLPFIAVCDWNEADSLLTELSPYINFLQQMYGINAHHFQADINIKAFFQKCIADPDISRLTYLIQRNLLRQEVPLTLNTQNRPEINPTQRNHATEIAREFFSHSQTHLYK